MCIWSQVILPPIPTFESANHPSPRQREQHHARLRTNASDATASQTHSWSTHHAINAEFMNIMCVARTVTVAYLDLNSSIPIQMPLVYESAADADSL